MSGGGPVAAAPRGLRLQIGVFGRRNVGKSAIFNALLHQQVAIVSPVAGTTTDPVEKAMEWQPLGPVLFVDTAGVDDVGALGQLRVAKTRQVIDRVDLAILIADAWQAYEAELLKLFQTRQLPVIVAVNKSDVQDPGGVAAAARAAGAPVVVATSAATGAGLDELRQALIAAAPADYVNAPALVADLVPPGEVAVLVVPIDQEAPKGRLILPQVQTIRDLLDHDAVALVVKERELAPALARLRRPPALVVTDSQAFLKVAADTPATVPLTSFSILFARFKGDLAALVRGATAIETLKPGARVLIAEACTHHPIADDIGRVKIPRWLEQYVGGKLALTNVAGRDYPADVRGYDLIVHCGACVWNRREMLARLAAAHTAGVPLTNYGLAIAYSLGIFARALEPFPAALEAYRETRGRARPAAGPAAG